jgi:hypothetical protein
MRKILHEANKGRSLSLSQTAHPLCFSRGEENGKDVEVSNQAGSAPTGRTSVS